MVQVAGHMVVVDHTEVVEHLVEVVGHMEVVAHMKVVVDPEELALLADLAEFELVIDQQEVPY